MLDGERGERGQGGQLVAGHHEAGDGRFDVRVVVQRPGGQQLLRLQHVPLPLLIAAQAHLPDAPRRLDGAVQLQVTVHVVGDDGHVMAGQQLLRQLGHRPDLPLLHDQGDVDAVLAGLHVEGAAAGRADGGCGDPVDGIEVEAVVHAVVGTLTDIRCRGRG